MRDLIITLLATSSVDSLNPIGITQQFILQGMVKKPRHIWYFIITTAVVNMIFGYMVYYGIINLLDRVWTLALNQYPYIIYPLEIVLGIGVFVFGFIWLKKLIVAKKQNLSSVQEKQKTEEDNIKHKIKSVSPLALINIGIISTASELTSAVPYFAFLSVLLTYHISFGVLTLILILYNIIYIAPFVLLFAIYLLSKKKFDKIYVFFRTKCRTLLEEVFCYVVERKGEEPSQKGDIKRLYKQVKDLYNMHADSGMDRRINELLSGLEKIIDAIAEMRNVNSDAHGVGQRRKSISEHHARLFVNSAMTMADFILSVAERQ